eukprot:2811774-Rhodomonas_salina.1
MDSTRRAGAAAAASVLLLVACAGLYLNNTPAQQSLAEISPATAAEEAAKHSEQQDSIPPLRHTSCVDVKLYASFTGGALHGGDEGGEGAEKNLRQARPGLELVSRSRARRRRWRRMRRMRRMRRIARRRI